MNIQPTHKVDLDNIDAVRRHIFNATYLYAIPGYYRYSAEYNRKVGHLDTGDKSMNQRVLSEYVDVGGTIADILKLYSQGADIRMRQGTDIVTIYEVLITHLNNWSNYVANDPNVKDAPVDQLHLMADFCETIKLQARGYKPRLPDVPEMKKMTSLFGAGAIAELFSPNIVGVQEADTEGTMNSIEKMLAERKKHKKR